MDGDGEGESFRPESSYHTSNNESDQERPGEKPYDTVNDQEDAIIINASIKKPDDPAYYPEESKEAIHDEFNPERKRSESFVLEQLDLSVFLEEQNNIGNTRIKQMLDYGKELINLQHITKDASNLYSNALAAHLQADENNSKGIISDKRILLEKMSPENIVAKTLSIILDMASILEQLRKSEKTAYTELAVLKTKMQSDSHLIKIGEAISRIEKSEETFKTYMAHSSEAQNLVREFGLHTLRDYEAKIQEVAFFNQKLTVNEDKIAQLTQNYNAQLLEKNKVMQEKNIMAEENRQMRERLGELNDQIRAYEHANIEGIAKNLTESINAMAAKSTENMTLMNSISTNQQSASIDMKNIVTKIIADYELSSKTLSETIPLLTGLLQAHGVEDMDKYSKELIASKELVERSLAQISVLVNQFAQDKIGTLVNAMIKEVHEEHVKTLEDIMNKKHQSAMEQFKTMQNEIVQKLEGTNLHKPVIQIISDNTEFLSQVIAKSGITTLESINDLVKKIDALAYQNRETNANSRDFITTLSKMITDQESSQRQKFEELQKSRDLLVTMQGREYDTMAAEIASLRKLNSEVQSIANAAQAEIYKLQSERDSLRNKLDILDHTIKENLAERGILGESLKSASSMLESTSKEKSALMEEVAKSHALNLELKLKVDSLKVTIEGKNRTIAGLESTIEMVRQSMSINEVDLKKSTTLQNSTIRNYEDIIAEHKKSVEAARNEVEIINTKYETLLNKYNTLEIDLTTQVRTLLQGFEVQKTTIDSLNEEIVHLKHGEVLKYKKEIELKTVKNQELQEELISLRENYYKNAAIYTYEKDIAVAQYTTEKNISSKLQNALEEATKRIEDLSQDVKKLNANNNFLDRKTSDQSAELVTLKNEKSTLEDKLRTGETIEKTLKEEIIRLTSDRNLLEQTIGVQSAELVTLKNEKSTLEDKLRTGETIEKRVKEEIIRLTSDRNLLEQTIGVQSVELVALKNEKSTLEDKLQTGATIEKGLNEEVIRLTSERDLLEQKISVQSAELVTLKIELRKVNEDRRTMSDTMGKQAVEIDNLKNELRITKDTVKKTGALTDEFKTAYDKNVRLYNEKINEAEDFLRVMLAALDISPNQQQNLSNKNSLIQVVKQGNRLATLETLARELQNQISKMDKQNRELIEDLSKSQYALMEHREHTIHLESELEIANKSVVSLTKLNQDLESRNRRLESDVADFRMQNSNLRDDFSSLETSFKNQLKDTKGELENVIKLQSIVKGYLKTNAAVLDQVIKPLDTLVNDLVNIIEKYPSQSERTEALIKRTELHMQGWKRSINKWKETSESISNGSIPIESNIISELKDLVKDLERCRLSYVFRELIDDIYKGAKLEERFIEYFNKVSVTTQVDLLAAMKKIVDNDKT